MDRLGIIRDMFALSEAGKFSHTELFAFLGNFKGETEYAVWSEIVSGIVQVFSLLSREKIADDYRKFALDLLAPIGKKLGFEKKKNEPHSDTLLRSMILSAQSLLGEQEIIATSRSLFSTIKVDKKALDPDIRSVVYSTVARYGNDKDHACFIKMYKE